MKIRLPFFMFIFFLSIFVLSYFPSDAFSQNINVGGPPPPPVNINLTYTQTSLSTNEVIVKIQITPLEDMHTDIKCILPEEMEVIQENGIIVIPYIIEEMSDLDKPFGTYRMSMELFVGPLTKGVTKEFIFKLQTKKKQPYEVIMQVQALAKWGFKEENFTIDVK